jgi:hypothetical protein
MWSDATRFDLEQTVHNQRLEAPPHKNTENAEGAFKPRQLVSHCSRLYLLYSHQPPSEAQVSIHPYELRARGKNYFPCFKVLRR